MSPSIAPIYRFKHLAFTPTALVYFVLFVAIPAYGI